MASTACNKSVSNRTANLPALAPANEDLNAGAWKTVLLSRPDTFPVTAPAATASVGYVAELNEIKGVPAKYQQRPAKQDEVLECRRNAPVE